MSRPDRYALEPSAADMRQLGEAGLEFVIRHIEALPDQPASDFDGALDLARELVGPAPEVGRPIAGLLDVIGRAATKTLNTAGPGHLAYIPGGGLYAAALADFVACAINRYVPMANAAPALAQIEATVIRWFCDLFGYPAEAQGILTSGGSMANFAAVVAARHARLGERFGDGVLYATDQVHHSVAKAAKIAGLPADNVRAVPTTPDKRMDPDGLAAEVTHDRAAGRRPFCVVASAGTVNTGIVDPLAEIAAVAAGAGLWLHVDAAYGGFFQLTARGRAALSGIEHADSITLDPHKGLFLPYGTGCLLVRDGERLRDAHHVGAAYLQDISAEGGPPSFAEYSPELSRDFRGLRVWLPIQLHGLGAFRESLDEKLDLARWAYEDLVATPGFEVPWEPDLSVVAFRYLSRRGDPDDANRRLLDAVNARRRVFLSSTLVDGRFTLRICVLSHRTHRDRVEEALATIKECAERLAEASGGAA